MKVPLTISIEHTTLEQLRQKVKLSNGQYRSISHYVDTLIQNKKIKC